MFMYSLRLKSDANTFPFTKPFEVEIAMRYSYHSLAEQDIEDTIGLFYAAVEAFPKSWVILVVCGFVYFDRRL